MLGPGLYRTDAFHRTPLFAVRPRGHDPDKPPLVVRSWEEAYALHGPTRLADINPLWIGHFISDDYCAEVSPYHRIKRLPRAHHVVIDSDGSIATAPFDPLSGGASRMNSESAYRYIRQGLLSSLSQSIEGHHGRIACEHSSGIDSNSVLGALVHGLQADSKDIYTISDDSWGEGALLNELRKFHGLDNEKIIRYSFQPTGTPRSSVLDGHSNWIKRFGAPPLVVYPPMEEPLSKLREASVSLLFSGLGGDECISNRANNVPTDLVAERRWAELVQWCGGKRKAIRTAMSRIAGLSSRQWAERKMRSIQGKEYTFPLTETLTEDGRLALQLSTTPRLWGDYSYLKTRTSIRREVLSDFLALRMEEEIRMASSYGIQKIFPLINESMIATLLNQDPTVFGIGKGKGRSVAKKAFKDFLPEHLIEPMSKKFRSEELELQNERRYKMHEDLQVLLHEISLNLHPTIRKYWEFSAFESRIAKLTTASKTSISQEVWNYGYAICRLIIINKWFVLLDCS